MKILAISPRIPEASRKGDQVLSFHRLSYLAKRHQIVLVCFGNAEYDLQAKSNLEALGIKVALIRWNIVTAGMNVLWSAINTSVPLQCAFFESSSFRKLVNSLLVELKPDLIYAVTIRAIVNLGTLRIPIFVDIIDSMALNFHRRMKFTWGLKYLLYRFEYHRVKIYEYKVAQMARYSFVVSSIDQKLIGSDKIAVIPLGVDTSEFYNYGVKSTVPTVVFTGNMNYIANAEAVLWFYQHCWNRLKLSVPHIRLVICGSDPTAEVTALRADDSVTVTGRVSSISAVINTASVSIAPMQSGSGMQFKILEAMACGIPVVTNTLGMGGIKAKFNKDLLLADTPDTFVESVLSLLKFEEVRARIGDSGRQYVVESHSWDVLNAEFESLILDKLN